MTGTDVQTNQIERTDAADSVTPSRRTALRVAGGGALAMLGVAGLSGRAIAQEATPATQGASKIGRYVVMRTRTVRADVSDESIEELNGIVSNGLAPIIRAIPGYVDYYVVMNEETRERTSVSIFNDKAGIEESNRQAAEFLSGYPNYYDDLDPVILEGMIVVEAG